MQSKIQTKKILQAFWLYTKPYRWHMLGICLSLVVAILFSDIIPPLFYKRFFDTLEQGDRTPDALAQLISIIWMIAGLHFVGWIGWRSMGLILQWYTSRIMANMDVASLKYLHNHSYRFFANHFAGSLVRKVGRFSRAYDEFADQMVYGLFWLSIALVGELTVLWTRHHGLAWMVLAWVGGFMVFQLFYAKWKVRYDARQAELDSQATGALADSVSNAMTVKAFAQDVHELSLFEMIREQMRRATRLSWNLNELLESIQSFLILVIELVVFLYALRLWQAGTITLGDFALVQGILLHIFFRVWDFGRAVRRIYGALADADEMVEIMNTPNDIIDVPGAKDLHVPQGEIVFDHVTFQFGDRTPVLQDLSFTIRPGERVALVGSSGAGKSTIIKLLMRFYDVTSGRIIIDGQSTREVTQSSLRSQISLVPQEPILFHRSIFDNIQYGRLSATREEVIDCAQKSHAHEFVEKMPKQYDTFVGERGVKLSGGERQRIAIARAMVSNAPILLLDEATSSLDSESELYIQSALDELMKNKTTIVIAHRLSTIMKMDRILVIDHGRVVDEGTHTALIAKTDGLYKSCGISK